jgi:glutamate--cysteine ligase
VGLLYEPGTLAEALALVADWSAKERQQLRDTVPRFGLDTPFRGETVATLAKQVVAIAEKGLKRRALLDPNGDDERKHLAPLIETVEEGRSPADRLLTEYERAWKGDINRLFDEHGL